MNRKLQTKVQANTTQTFTPVLQKPRPLSNSPHLILQRRDHHEPTVQEPGQPVPGTPAFFEPGFGHDFSRVRIYNKGSVRDLPIQTKLRINKPGDVYEEEADRVAEQVMRMEEPGMQRWMEEEETLQAKEIPSQIPEVTPNLEARINAIRGGGQPLPESTRAFFEPRFGHDFSQVRVHTDANAAESARAVNARAFTVGQDVVFRAGQYVPGASEGRRLLAHELTHVVQQTVGLSNPIGLDLQRQSEAGLDPFIKNIDKMSEDPKNNWVPGHIWGLLKLMMRMGRFGRGNPHWLKRFNSGDPYWGDIIVLWHRRIIGGVNVYTLELYQEFPSSAEYWREKNGFDDDNARRAASAAKSWNNKMWKILGRGLYKVNEARQQIKEVEHLHLIYSLLKAIVGAAGSFYPIIK